MSHPIEGPAEKAKLFPPRKELSPALRDIVGWVLVEVANPMEPNYEK
jgi:hypothetical protein